MTIFGKNYRLIFKRISIKIGFFAVYTPLNNQYSRFEKIFKDF